MNKVSHEGAPLMMRTVRYDSQTRAQRTERCLRTLLRFRAAAPAILLAILGGACANIVAQNAPGALQTAESRARFELNCPTVQATILSQKLIQGFRFDGSEHTIGVRGCGREAIYLTYCSDATDCNALSQTGRINTWGNSGQGPGAPGPFGGQLLGK